MNCIFEPTDFSGDCIPFGDPAPTGHPKMEVLEPPLFKAYVKVSLIYCTEPETKNNEKKKLKTKADITQKKR